MGHVDFKVGRMGCGVLVSLVAVGGQECINDAQVGAVGVVQKHISAAGFLLFRHLEAHPRKGNLATDAIAGHDAREADLKGRSDEKGAVHKAVKSRLKEQGALHAEEAVARSGLAVAPLAKGFCHAGVDNGVDAIGGCAALMEIVAQQFLVKPSAFKQSRANELGERVLYLRVRAQELFGHVVAVENGNPAVLQAATDETLATADAARNGKAQGGGNGGLNHRMRAIARRLQVSEVGNCYYRCRTACEKWLREKLGILDVFNDILNGGGDGAHTGNAIGHLVNTDGATGAAVSGQVLVVNRNNEG